MKTWLWLATVPAGLFVAHLAGGTLVQQASASAPAIPDIVSVKLPERNGEPVKIGVGEGKDIRLAAFGMVLPEEVKLDMSEGKIPAKAADLFVLQSILVTPKVATASIDGRVVKVGDRLRNGFRVARIEPQRVILAGPRGQESLRFPEYRDPPVAAFAQGPVMLQPQAAVAPAAGGANVNQGTNPNFKQILEMLKL